MITQLNTKGNQMERIVWELGIRKIGSWTIFPWIRTDEYGWGFSWIFLSVCRYTIPEDDIDELGI